MRVLHLFSNWRWTGPAEPAVNLAAALHRHGWDTTFVCGAVGRRKHNAVLSEAHERGVPTRTGLTLNKHINPFTNYPDGRRLREWLQAEPFDVMHCHLRNAHIVAALAARPLPDRPIVVRTCYAGDGPRGYWERRLVNEFTDGLILVSEQARRHAVETLGFPADRTWVVHTAISLERFDPGRGLGDRRAELGIAPDAFVVGIVARIQWRRRYDVFLEAIDRLRRKLANVRALIVGRGTNTKPIVLDPVQRMGLGDIVLRLDYQEGDDYVRTLASMDVKVYLVPGTDGSCRAVREAMAMGVPVVAARRGMLPELVAHGQRGLVIDDTPENLADALLALAHDPRRRQAMGSAARAYASTDFSLDRQAETVGRIYRDLAERGKR